MTHQLNRWTLKVLGVAVLLHPGCGESRFQQTYKVNGRVTLDDKPVHGVMVQLIPKRTQGITDKDGYFELSTYYKGDGAPAGDYGVALLDEPRSQTVLFFRQHRAIGATPVLQVDRLPQGGSGRQPPAGYVRERRCRSRHGHGPDRDNGSALGRGVP